MTGKRTRRALDNMLANEFVYGDSPATPAPAVAPEPEPNIPLQASETTASPTLPRSKKPRSPSRSQSASTKESFVAKLMAVPDKEATIRLTVDLAESMHRKLSILAARSGKKKAEIVRMLLEDALDDVDE